MRLTGLVGLHGLIILSCRNTQRGMKWRLGQIFLLAHNVHIFTQPSCGKGSYMHVSYLHLLKNLKSRERPSHKAERTAPVSEPWTASAHSAAKRDVDSANAGPIKSATGVIYPPGDDRESLMGSSAVGEVR